MFEDWESIIRPHDIVAIEVYVRGAFVPPRFGGGTSPLRRHRHLDRLMAARRPRGPGGRLLLFLAALAAPHHAHGQAVEGRVLDTRSAMSLGAARVSVLDGTAELASTLTDSEGRFFLDWTGPRTVTVYVESLGYYTWVSDPLEVGDEPLAVEVAIRPQPFLMDSIRVEVRRERRLDAVGFYARERRLPGRFLGRAWIERRAGARFVGDLLHGVPGPMIMPSWVGPDQIFMRVMPTVQYPQGVCVPRVYVDGVVMARGVGGDGGP